MAQWKMLILVEKNLEIHELELEKTSCQKVPQGCSSEGGGGSRLLKQRKEGKTGASSHQFIQLVMIK